MTSQIKQRIEQINNGQVPEGYKKTEFGIFPSDWVTDKKLKDIGSFDKGRGLPGDKMRDSGVPCVGYGDIYMKYNNFHFEKAENFVDEDTASESLPIEKGTLLFTGTGETAEEIGKCVCYNGDETIYAGGDIITFKTNEVNPLFLAYQQYQSYSLARKASFGQGHSVVHIHANNLEKLNVAYPKSTAEQEKIAEILMKWDKAIELQEKYIKKLKNQKDGYIKQVLTSGSKYWEKHPLSCFLFKRNETQIPSTKAPLMAFIAYEGISEKGERYDRSQLVKDDNKKYKITYLNDFIYSSNNLDVGSIGLNKYGTAVISVVYEVFGINEKAIPNIINEIIQLPRNMNRIINYRQGAFYGQYKINPDDFLKIEVHVPPMNVQVKLSNYFSSLENNINKQKEKHQLLIQQRKAIQQYLLNGIVRVEV
mgnify:FL=1